MIMGGKISSEEFFIRRPPKSAWTPSAFSLRSLFSLRHPHLEVCAMKICIRGMTLKCIRSVQLPFSQTRTLRPRRWSDLP